MKSDNIGLTCVLESFFGKFFFGVGREFFLEKGIFSKDYNFLSMKARHTFKYS